MVRGDDALVKRDFAAAAAAYEKANQLETTPELEAKVRFAGACVLYEEALTAIADGDLLGAEQRLRSSLWKYPIQEARAKLTKLAPAFEAARLVRKADLAAARKDYAEAERLYTETIPNLPQPAKGAVEDKLKRLHEAATQPGTGQDAP
jgi:tetratricopeptide (TPR) repeat protein